MKEKIFRVRPKWYRRAHTYIRLKNGLLVDSVIYDLHYDKLHLREAGKHPVIQRRWIAGVGDVILRA